MKALTPEDILPLERFAAERQKMQAQVLEAKAPRRIAIGPNMTLLFENRLTIQWQIQEMCRVEHLTKPEAIEGELEAYNPLLPGPSELSATLLIEYEEAVTRAAMLVKLSGLDRHMRLELDGTPPVRAVFEQGRERLETGKVSAVQFVRFPLSPAQREAFLDLRRQATLVVDHPAYSVKAALTSAQRGALADDLCAA